MAIREPNIGKPEQQAVAYAILYAGAIVKLIISSHKSQVFTSQTPEDLAAAIALKLNDRALTELDQGPLKASAFSRSRVIFTSVLAACARELKDLPGACEKLPLNSLTTVAELNIAPSAGPLIHEAIALLRIIELAIPLSFNWSLCKRSFHDERKSWLPYLESLCAAVNSNAYNNKNPSNIKRVADVTEVMGQLLNKIAGPEGLKHIQHVCGIGDTGAALRAMAIGRSVEERLQHDKTSGAFFVYRRARTSITNKQNDIDLFVRDFVWLMPELPNTYSKDTGIRGYYFSAFDEEVYEIRSQTTNDDGLLKIDGVAKRTNRPDKALSLFAPNIRYQDGPTFTLGTIVGSLRDTKRTGGWTCVLIRPDLSPEEIWAINTVIYSFHRTLSSTKTDYGNEIDRFRNVIQGICLAGVYTSRSLESKKYIATNETLFTRECATIRRKDIMSCFCHDQDRQNSLVSFVDELIVKHGLDTHEQRLEIDRVRAAIIEAIIETSTSTTVPNSGYTAIREYLEGDTGLARLFLKSGRDLMGMNDLDELQTIICRLRDVRLRKTMSMTQYDSLMNAKGA